MMPFFSKRFSGLPKACRDVRRKFSPYLDGGLSGRVRSHLAAHLEACSPCSEEFTAWRLVQRSVAVVGPARAPEDLQAQLRDALRAEREQNHHLSLADRWVLLWHELLAPLALRVAGGLSIAAVLLGSLMGTYAPAITVMANDERMANLTAPHYLYSQVPLSPLQTRHDVPVLVEAKVDKEGRVYDYSILAGPKDEAVQRRVEENLLASVFKPATAFGVPVLGHVVITYTGVSVRG
jgi:anti-sigma factor RsiW